MSRRDVFVFPDGGEEEEAAAAGEDRLLAAAQHRGQGGHQEIRREVPQEEGRCHGNNPFFLLLVSGRCCLDCFYAFYIQSKAII